MNPASVISYIRLVRIGCASGSTSYNQQLPVKKTDLNQNRSVAGVFVKCN
jgi:hypothetical protein